jgi:hypothetical protein
MNSKLTTSIVALLTFVVGYFVGREHLKYEFRQSMETAMAGIGTAFSSAFTGTDKAPIVQPSAPVGPSKEELTEAAAKSEYIRDFITLSDITAAYKEQGFDGNVPVVKGKLKNVGTKTLTRVKVVAYFKDKDGKTIYENDFPAVFVGGFSSGDTPLKPNYIKDFGFKSKDCPKEWSEGSVDVVISDIEFAK